MDSLASKEQEDNIIMACSTTFIWRAFTRAKIPAIKEPNGPPDQTAKGLTESPSYLRTEVVAWHGMSRGQILSLHPTNIIISQNAGAAAEKAARNKENKYAVISQSHHLVICCSRNCRKLA